MGRTPGSHTTTGENSLKNSVAVGYNLNLDKIKEDKNLPSNFTAAELPTNESAQMHTERRLY